MKITKITKYIVNDMCAWDMSIPVIHTGFGEILDHLFIYMIVALSWPLGAFQRGVRRM